MASGNHPASPTRGAVLITGARGFVGRALANLLQRKGYEIVSADVSPFALDAGGSQVLCDVSDVAQLRAVFEANRIAGIIHLAAILPTVAQREPEPATRVNVHGSFNVLEMARRSGARRLVFGSSLSVYGTYPADHAGSEVDRTAPGDLYGASKLYVEQLGEAYRQRYGLEFVSLRIGRVVGSGARSTTSAWRSEIFEFLSTTEAKEIVIPYSASERVLLVYVNDVAEMLLKLLQAEHLQHSVYNACCESVVLEELKRTVEQLNPNVRIRLGDADVTGNPRRLDCSRFRKEFDFGTVPIFEQLREAAARGVRRVG